MNTDAVAVLGFVALFALMLLRVPVVMGVLHQLGAVLVLTAALLALSALQTTNGRRTSPAVVDRGAARPVSSP
mgnify:CR=1 FL=1